MNRRHLAVVGAGWAGCTAAVRACQVGWQVSLFESARQVGGRARGLDLDLPDGRHVRVDNGQHILIGAYRETLALMRELGVDADAVLHRSPLTLRFPDGSGLAQPDWPAPWDALWGMLSARGWTWGDRWSLLRASLAWQRAGFVCDASLDVATLCRNLSPRVMATLIEPLCVSALNTPPERASAAVMLRVLRDALFGAPGGSHLLLPRRDLGALLPEPAWAWLMRHGARCEAGARVLGLTPLDGDWQLSLAQGGGTHTVSADAVLLACPAAEAARLVDSALAAGLDGADGTAGTAAIWCTQARALQHEAIATVYAWAEGARLDLPMLSLPSDAQHPAQFVFDRGQLDGPPGLLAFVVSASAQEREAIEQAVIAQGRSQLGLQSLRALRTVVERRATFACTPGLQRPAAHIAPGLAACGDWVEGPYPATLEGAVMSAQPALTALATR